MSTSQQGLCVFYALAAVAALVATWSQNVAYLGEDPLHVFAAFVDATRVTPASRSITVDIGFFVLAGAAFMVSEARRLGARYVWLYILFAFLVAISVTFALFMIARERQMARAAEPGAPATLNGVDIAGLALVTVAVVGLCWRVLC